MSISGSFALRYPHPIPCVLPHFVSPLTLQGLAHSRKQACERREFILHGTAPLSPYLTQGDTWLSQVPELPLWTHALVSDPGGDPNTRRIASRSAAFRGMQSVGFLLQRRIIQ